jgi:signal transduction histidine kinase
VSSVTTDSTRTEAYARLLSLAAHEFRTPASVVGGYLRMLRNADDPALSERQRRLVDEAEKSFGRMVALVDELSDLARLDTGTAAFQAVPFDFFEVVERTAAGVREGQDRGVTLEARGETGGAPLIGDPLRVQRAVTAFLRAVLREQPSARAVVVDRRRVADGPSAAAVAIIAPRGDVDAALDAPPVAFDETRGGLGLALPIARRVVERHGGRVWSAALAPAADGGTARGAIVLSFPLREQGR